MTQIQLEAEKQTRCADVSPDDVSSQDAVLMAFWRRLPLNHDGLVGAAASNDVLWGRAGRLLRKRDPGGKKVFFGLMLIMHFSQNEMDEINT